MQVLRTTPESRCTVYRLNRATYTELLVRSSYASSQPAVRVESDRTMACR